MSFDSSSYPYRTVVYISDTIGGQGFHGSGVLISPDEVLTASHVVYSSDFGTASDITVTPAYSGGFAPVGSASADYFHYFQLDDSRDLISTAQSQFDYAVIHLSASFDVGTMGLQSGFSGGAVNVSGYPGLSGVMELSRQTVSQDPSYSVLDGRSIGPGSSGGPVWITKSDGLPYVVGVVSSGSDITGAGTFVQITDTVFNQIQSWVRQDDAASGPGNLVAFDTTTNQAFNAIGQSYSGPVQGVQDQYIDVTGDSINIAASGNGWFIHSGGGNDAIAVHGGVNVVDGGTGSNFLTGGSGTDTFYVDDRAAAADIWTTVVGLHAGDDATVWGITPGNFNLAWVDDDGAAGYTGVTLHTSEAGKPTASLTLTGYSLADLTNGRLSPSFGSIDSNTPYLYVHANA